MSLAAPITAVAVPQAAPAEKLRMREVLSYGAADLGQISLMQLSSIYLLFFYTDILLLSAGTIGTVVMLTRLWDAIFDPILGLVVDHTYTRWGRCRPYLIPGSICLALSCVAIFYAPELQGVALLVYVIITFNLFNMAFSVTNLPMTAQLPLMTADDADRVKLSAVRAFFQSCAYAGVPIIAELLFSVLGSRDDPMTFTLLALLVGVFCVIVFIDTFRNTRERVYLKPEKIAWRELRQVFFGSSSWVLVLVCNLLVSTALLARTAAAIYHFQYVMEDLRWFGLFMTLSSIAMIPFSFIATPLAARIGKGNFALLGCIIGTFGNLLILWQPLSPVMLLAGSFLSGCAIAAFICVLFAMEGDIADEAHARTGVRVQGVLCAIIALGYKVALGLGTGSVGWLLGDAGYDATAETASQEVQDAIAVAFIWIPLLGNFLGGITLLFYKLDARLPGIKAQLGH